MKGYMKQPDFAASALQVGFIQKDAKWKGGIECAQISPLKCMRLSSQTSHALPSLQ